MALPPVRHSWRQLSDASWVIGEKLLLTRQSTWSPDCNWSDGNRTYFSISETSGGAASTPPEHIAAAIPFPLVYDAGDSHAVWKIGDAFLKIVIPASLDTTREHVNLIALRNMEIDFTVPEVLYHGEWDGRYYLILTKVPGQTLHEAWPLMNEKARHDCVCQVVKICSQLAMRQSGYIGGIDGRNLPETFLSKDRTALDFSSDVLRRNCEAVKMDCSTFVFYHCDLGPGNILVDLAAGSIAIIDWECAGYVPREWVRTKFRVCGGLDLEIPPGLGATHDWRSRMQRRLEEEGFADCAAAWKAWWDSKD